MYFRPRFLEELHAIREEMSRECDYDMDRFAAAVRNNDFTPFAVKQSPHHLKKEKASTTKPSKKKRKTL